MQTASILSPIRILRLAGLLVLAALSSNCTTVRSWGQTQPVRTKPNTAYRTPAVRGPVPRNPDLHLPSGGHHGGISFSQVSSVSGPYIAITFDDGPSAASTPRLLDLLRSRNIKATFYVLGENVQAHPEIVRRIVAEGHEIGSHTWDHKQLTKMGDDAVRSEINRTRDAIRRAAGVEPQTLRPPYGAMSSRQREFVHQEYGYPIVLWSVDPLDWKRPGSSVVSSRIVAGTRRGSIILAHDIHAPTIEAMPATLDALLRKGFRFVTVSQLLAMKSGPAKPDKEPAPMMMGE